MQVCLELQLLSNFALHVQLPIVQTSVQSENWTISQMAEIKTSLEQKSALLNTASRKPLKIASKHRWQGDSYVGCFTALTNVPEEHRAKRAKSDKSGWRSLDKWGPGISRIGPNGKISHCWASPHLLEKPCGAWCWIRPGDSYYCKMTPEWHKMWSRLTAQICHFFWLITRNQDFWQQVSYFNVSRQKVLYFDVFNTGKAC